MKTTLPQLKQNKNIRLGGVLNLILYLLFFSILPISTSAQLTKACWNSPGSSGEFTLNKIYLASDLAGTPLTTSACSLPGNVNVYLAVSITNTTNSTRQGIFLAGDITSAGNTVSYSRCFDVVLNNNTPTIAVDPTPFTWTCGEALSMSSPFVGWGNGSGSICGASCSGISPSKCRTYGNTIIATPLVAKFTYNSNCPGGTSFGTINLTSTTTGGNNIYTYKWESSTDNTTWTQFSTIQSPTFSPGNNNPYYIKLTVTDTSSPQNTDSEIVSNITAGICCTTPVITNKTTSICSGSSFSVSPATGGSEIVPGDTSYSWNAPSVTGITGTLAGTNAANISGTLINSTNLTKSVVYTVTPKSGSCTGSTFTVTVTVDPSTVSGAVTGGTTVCTNTNSTMLTLGTHTGSVVRWESSTDGTNWTPIANTTNTYTATNITTTTQFRAVVKSGLCAEANSTPTTITRSTPIIITPTKTNVKCYNGNDGTITLSISGGTPTYTYTWKKDTNPILNTTKDLSGIGFGIYEVTVTDANSCTATTQVTISQPAIAVSVSGIATNATCFGEANGSIAVTNGEGSTVVITNAQNQVVSNTGLVAGTYTLTASAPNGNANGSCTATAQVTITQPAVAVS
ncbi:MAG: PKD-like domain-containing protein, partial [Bacteroidota bacterium]